ncbi:MAG: hypothetical protein DCC51_16140 [Anaerolineae bacterium]|nr:MAG: hypothetical protein DCC51_16140 [Anaerolineae bacterium]
MATKIDRRDFLKLGIAATATAAIGIGMSDRSIIPLPMAAQVGHGHRPVQMCGMRPVFGGLPRL